jgi:hypothetical protein
MTLRLWVWVGAATAGALTTCVITNRQAEITAAGGLASQGALAAGDLSTCAVPACPGCH